MKETIGWALVLTLVCGCSAQVTTRGDGTVRSDSGSLVVDWTIDGVRAPSQCDASGADAIDITVTGVNGRPAGEYQQSCDAFATSIELAPGTYVADAALLDATGRDRTTSVPINTFDIYGGDELDVPVDFPANSFY